MAGYILYSLDWDRFQSLVNNPTRKQLLKFAEPISDGLDQHDGEFEDGDPVHDWPSEPVELCDLVKDRLARPDWYGDLSDAGVAQLRRRFSADRLPNALRGLATSSGTNRQWPHTPAASAAHSERRAVPS